MTAREWEALLTVMTDAAPKSIFFELAFLESYVESADRRFVGVPLAMVEAALPFWEEEFNWRPRVSVIGQLLEHPALLRAAASLALVGVLASAISG